MNLVKSLEPDELERYKYLGHIFESSFGEIYLTFHISGILVGELLSLLPLCSFLFDEYGFPDPEHRRLLDQALTGAVGRYLAVFHRYQLLPD